MGRFRITRREALLYGGAAAVGSAARGSTIAEGPVAPTWESLAEHYRVPDWFRDAKFGIWAHWGPQC